jgi:hypothetical protein
MRLGTADTGTPEPEPESAATLHGRAPPANPKIRRRIAAGAAVYKQWFLSRLRANSASLVCCTATRGACVLMYSQVFE